MNKTQASIAILLLLFISTAFRLWGITKQFEVWDETAIVRVGEIYLDAWRNEDFSKKTWSLNKEHPPFAKYIYGATRVISLNVPYFRDKLDQEYPLGRRYTFQRIVSVLIGTFAVLLVYLLAGQFYDRKTALLASASFAFIPYFVAHSRVATQENMVMFLTLFSTYIFFKALYSGKLKDNKFLLSGFILGLAIATKYNAFIFLVLFAVLALYEFNKTFLKKWKSIFNNYIILIPVISMAVFYVVWPWLWPNPVSRFIESMFVRVGPSRINNPATEYFLGQYPHNNPWYYFFVYFIATTPPILLLGIMLFVIKFIWNRQKHDVWFMLYLLTPFLAVLSPLKIDGVRYIFTIYPAVGICSAVGYYWIIRGLRNVFDKYTANLIAKLLPVIIVGILLVTNAVYHPYTWDYYNFLFGGAKNVYEKRLFDFGYWGEGLRKAFNFVEKEQGEHKLVYYKFIPVHVIPTRYNTIMETDAIEEADYVIINPTGKWLNETNYLNYDFPYNFKLVLSEDRFDAPIVRVYKRLKPYEEPIER